MGRKSRYYELEDDRIPRVFCPNNPYPPRIYGLLAGEIGLNESIVFLQLEWLVSLRPRKWRDGLLWTYQSTRKLKNDYFQWWGKSTINRIIHSLQEKQLIIVRNYNQKSYDKTRWFAINFEEVAKLKSIEIKWPDE